MIETVYEDQSEYYVDTIEFLELEMRKVLSDGALYDSSKRSKKILEVKTLYSKLIQEYDNYISHALKINPLALKGINTLRKGKKFWVDWNDEEFKEFNIYD